MVSQDNDLAWDLSWVLLSYRVPREPSTPRIAVWRRLKNLGVVQIGDGLVGLPTSDETREQLEWVAAQVIEADGEAVVWTAQPTTRADSAALIEQQRSARDQEYDKLVADIGSAGRPVDTRTIARWRRELRRIEKRDHFSASRHDAAQGAVAEIANRAASTEPAR